MMNNLYALVWGCATLIFTGCTFSLSQAQVRHTGWEEYDLKGRVKRLTIRTFKAHNESGKLVKGDLWSTTIVDFSEDGRSLQEERINESKKTYVYLDMQTVINHYDADGSLKNKKITAYTDWGDIKNIVEVNAEGVELSRTNYVYNKDRQLVERIHQDIGFSYTREANIQYDTIGHEIRCERYSRDNLLKEVEINSYDLNGKRIMHRVERYDDGVFLYSGTERFTYNTEGFICLVESCNDTEDYHVTHEISYSYDNYGNFTKENIINDWFSTIKERTIIYY